MFALMAVVHYQLVSLMVSIIVAGCVLIYFLAREP